MVDGLFASVRHGKAAVAGTKSCCVVGLEPDGMVMVTGDFSVVCAAAASENSKNAKKIFNGYSPSQ